MSLPESRAIAQYCSSPDDSTESDDSAAAENDAAAENVPAPRMVQIGGTMTHPYPTPAYGGAPIVHPFTLFPTSDLNLPHSYHHFPNEHNTPAPYTFLLLRCLNFRIE